MSAAVERLVNLALYLAAAPGAVTADDIREDVAGYSPESDEATYKRMLERDKDVLRSAGLVIESNEYGDYHLDRAATYVAPLALSVEEAATVRIAGLALLDDPSFPFADDLRLALAKVAAESHTSGATVHALLADEEPSRQGETVATLADAASRRKRVSFDYTNSLGSTAPHEIEPYGLFLHDGRWYLVGRDVVKDEVRTYTVARIDGTEVDCTAPKTPSYELPFGFDVGSFIRLPFQYGPTDAVFTARLRFEPSAAWRAQRLASGHGVLSEVGDGSVEWEVEVLSAERLARFVVENGPGLALLSPAAACARLREGLERVGVTHA